MKTAQWNIDGMHCDGCAGTIKALLQAQSGVKAAEVSYPQRAARILYDPATTSEAALAATIKRAGYKVREA